MGNRIDKIRNSPKAVKEFAKQKLEEWDDNSTARARMEYYPRWLERTRELG